MDSSKETREAVVRLMRIGLGGDGSIPAVQDWESVFRVATALGVGAIAFDGYIKKYGAGAPEMPTALKKQWIALSYGFNSSFARQTKTAVEMAGFFAGNDIRTYVLKGRVVAECYPVPEHRWSSDMDCFLLPASGKEFNAWEKGNSLIEGKGIHVSRSFYKNSSFKLSGLLVENHRFLTPFRGNETLAKLESLLQELMRCDAGTDKFKDTELYRPPVMVSALFLIEHAFSHFLHEGLTLRNVTDWMMFRRCHEGDLEWLLFDGFIDKFGLRRFYEAYVHVGEYLIGDRSEESLTVSEQLMMDSVWEGLDLHETLHGVKGKLNLVGNTLRARWKYRLFSPISMLRALWIQVKGFLFIRHPKLPLSGD